MTIVHHAESIEQCAACGRTWCRWCDKPTLAIQIDSYVMAVGQTAKPTKSEVVCDDACLRLYKEQQK